ncbi:hypothetical protein Tco_0882480 [Tanacetum coccineum]
MKTVQDTHMTTNGSTGYLTNISGEGRMAGAWRQGLGARKENGPPLVARAAFSRLLRSFTITPNFLMSSLDFSKMLHLLHVLGLQGHSAAKSGAHIVKNHPGHRLFLGHCHPPIRGRAARTVKNSILSDMEIPYSRLRFAIISFTVQLILQIKNPETFMFVFSMEEQEQGIQYKGQLDGETRSWRLFLLVRCPPSLLTWVASVMTLSNQLQPANAANILNVAQPERLSLYVFVVVA